MQIVLLRATKTLLLRFKSLQKKSNMKLFMETLYPEMTYQLKMPFPAQLSVSMRH